MDKNDRESRKRQSEDELPTIQNALNEKRKKLKAAQDLIAEGNAKLLTAIRGSSLTKNKSLLTSAQMMIETGVQKSAESQKVITDLEEQQSNLVQYNRPSKKFKKKNNFN